MSRGNLGCVVVAVDGSEQSMYALNWALNNLKLKQTSDDHHHHHDGDEVVEASGGAAGGGGSFVILHVQSPPSIAAGITPGAIPFGGPSDCEVPAISAAIEAHQRRITEAIFERALQICAEKGEVNVKTQVVVGKPKEAICEVCENLHADLLVMGSHSYGVIKRMFLGSVSNYCNIHAPCPVIIVKDAPEKKASKRGTSIFGWPAWSKETKT